MVAFVDTSIVVDILRNYPLAVQWFAAHQAPLSITPTTWMEVVTGGETKAKQLRAVNFMRHFDMVYPTRGDMDWAMQQQLVYQRSHGVQAGDCLIAAPSFRLQLPLYTQNLKHFAPLLKSLAQKPY